MDIFESLVEELKEANLLEETVIEKNGFKNNHAQPPENAEAAGNEENPPSEIAFVPNVNHTTPAETAPIKNSFDEKEFFRKRATDEVTALQMVEHVFSGVEREHMKIIPKTFDDLDVKKSLHAFLQLNDPVDSPEHAQAEFQLMQETESWFSALTHRDKNISVSNLRRYCELTRPALSSQALLALARFYRNSPYSEAVRSKFDLTVTRFLAKDVRNEKRSLVFNRDEMISHLNELYAEWSSIPLYSSDEDDSTILLTVLKFEDFMTEADSAGSFDELIKNDFFNRLRVFKESTNENFFAPIVAATAIECNVRVGNRYIELLDIEKEKQQGKKLEEKYGFLHDQVISEATGKSLQLLRLINEKVKEKTPEKTAEKIEEKPKPAKAAAVGENKTTRPVVSNWVIVFSFIALLISFGFYFWAENSSADTEKIEMAAKVNLESSFLKEHIKTASLGNGLFFGVVETSWSQLSRENKENFLRKVVTAGKERNYTKVHLINSKGEKVAYGEKEMIEIYD